MTEQQLGVAISDLYDMERSNYQTMRLIQELDNRCSRLGVSKPFSVIDTRYTSSIKNDGKWKTILFAIGELIGFVILIIYEIIDSQGTERSTFYWIGEILLAIFAAFLLGGVIGCVLGFFGMIIDKYRYQKALQEEKLRYDYYFQQLAADRSRAIAQDRNRVQRELVVKSGLTAELGELRTRLQEGRQAIQTMYDDAGIDTAYRKLIPIRYMYDYYNLGISKKLEGTDGLYYLVRQELRADQFNASLQDISSKMSTLIKGQSEVYRELCEANNRSAKMIGELINHVDNMSSNMISEAVNIRGEIAKGTQVAAYTTKRMEAEISYLSYFSSLRSQGIGISAK